MTSGRFIRVRRKANPGQPSEALRLARDLIADPRFRALVPSHRYLMLVAAMVWADPTGMFYVKMKTWAAQANMSVSSVKRAIRAGEATGLVAVERYLRPDGRQGASHYWLRPASKTTLDPPSHEVTQDPSHKVDPGRATERGGPPETDLNGIKNVKSERAPSGAATGAAAVEMDCTNCGDAVVWRQIGCYLVCQSCGDQVLA